MMLLSGVATAQLRNQAIKDGMISLVKDGMLKVRTGITIPSEVL